MFLELVQYILYFIVQYILYIKTIIPLMGNIRLLPLTAVRCHHWLQLHQFLISELHQSIVTPLLLLVCAVVCACYRHSSAVALWDFSLANDLV